MPLILGTNSIKDTGYDVANSCRFNDGDTAYMHKTFASGGTETAWTISMWVKRGALGSDQRVFSCDDSSDGDPDNYWRFKSDDTLQVYIYNGSEIGNLVTNRKFRDCSSWYHVCVIWKSGDSTSTDRLQLWVNGTRETSFSATTFPSEDAATVTSSQVVAIGRRNYGPQQYFDGYLAEVVFLDGVTASPVGTLGEFDEDSPTIFKAKDPSGLSFGTNGFYLDFEDSSNLGNDANGGTDFTEVNLAATDQCSDSPTNNFATLNPLCKGSYTTLSNGNLTTVGNTSSDNGTAVSTIPLAFSGKYYWEVKLTQYASGYPVIGLFLDWESVSQGDMNGGGSHFVGSDDVYVKGNSDTTIYSADGDITSQTGYADGDIIMFAGDMDNGALYIGRNGTWQNSGDPESGASETGKIVNLDTTKQHMMTVHDYNGSDTDWNFGNPSFSISSGNADGNGYGNFEYAPPSGYLALCTKNLGSDGG